MNASYSNAALNGSCVDGHPPKQPETGRAFTTVASELQLAGLQIGLLVWPRLHLRAHVNVTVLAGRMPFNVCVQDHAEPSTVRHFLLLPSSWQVQPVATFCIHSAGRRIPQVLFSRHGAERSRSNHRASWPPIPVRIGPSVPGRPLSKSPVSEDQVLRQCAGG